ncbi:hypothetical protein MSP8886_01437 [Marinomonas spartinae]|uniref:Uncharacterized protein n=1 Tax=Marinomonas spartinae TaxID=1792290 RepID=A0A1A8TAK8_9GAMM|nr:hypothetical protein [Marinomonas spartinae]SBS29099.1 hypothetical protein MSP8886_01437 [Marinomonas spartinae]
MHKIESIMVAITNALTSAMQPTVVERTPVYKSDKTRVLIRQGAETTEGEGAFTDAVFDLVITQVVLTQSTQLEVLANQYRGDIHKALMALQGKVPGMTEISSYRVGESEINSEQPALSRELVYQVRYRYNTQDPSL